MRIGFGYDSHRLVAGRSLVLGGRVIPHERGLLGHSDADVLLHAVCDAILGAAGEGDIGRQFPDTDPAYKDVSSLLLLERVRNPRRRKGVSGPQRGFDDRPGEAEARRLSRGDGGKHRGRPRDPPARVSVKAKTNEGMGLVGAGEGAAAFAVVTLAGGDAA